MLSMRFVSRFALVVLVSAALSPNVFAMNGNGAQQCTLKQAPVVAPNGAKDLQLTFGGNEAAAIFGKYVDETLYTTKNDLEVQNDSFKCLRHFDRYTSKFAYSCLVNFRDNAKVHITMPVMIGTGN